MAAQDDPFQIKPPPPPAASKEIVGVWSAWGRMGDREVVRESVAKGTHIDWAQRFLATRRKQDPVKAENFFRDEVFTWVRELISSKQIFKATHVMANIQVDPVKEFTRLFLTSSDSVLRNYLGNHLIKLGTLEEEYKETWDLLKVVEDRFELLTEFQDDLRNATLEMIHNRSYEWKCKIGTVLYFRCYDPTIKSFVNPWNCWTFFLRNDDVQFLKLWINVYFTQSTDFNFVHVNPTTYQHLSQMFLNLKITQDMVELLREENEACPETRESILNELSTFGVFTAEERRDLVRMLSRVAKNENISELYKMLTRETADLDHFHEMLIEFCCRKNLFTVLNWCNVDFTRHIDLIERCQSKSLDFMFYLRQGLGMSEEDVGQNILAVSRFLSDDLHQYFRENPLILLSLLMLLCRETDLLEILSKEELPKMEGFVLTPDLIEDTLKSLPFLNALVKRSDNLGVTYFDLLKTHGKFNADLFNFEDGYVPNFSSKHLVQFGYTKTVGYSFYLKQGRPCFAVKSFSRGSASSKVHKILCQTFPNREVAAACVAFLEMQGEDSTTTRIHIKASETLLDSGLSVAEVQELLQNVTGDPGKLLKALEEALVKDFALGSDFSGEDLVEEVKKHHLAVKFSQTHRLKLPELFLTRCAGHNLFLPFLLYVQLYSYPLSDVQRLIQNFSSIPLSEHLFHGLSHDIRVDDHKRLMRDSRKSYLLRIGVKKHIEAGDGSIQGSMRNCDVADGSIQSSSFSSMGSGSSSGSDYLESEPPELRTDLLQVLIKCHNSIDPPKALLQACHVYKSPICAVLATSYEPDSVVTNWLTWIMVSCEETQPPNLEALVSNAVAVSALLKTTISRGYGKLLYESLQIFLPDNPLKFFMDFLNYCVDLNFDEFAQQKLSNFEHELKQKKPSNILDVDYEMTYLSSRTWIESTACSLLSTSLAHCFCSQYHQLQFLNFLHKSYLNQVFSHALPDFSRLSTVLNYLLQSKCDIKLDLSVIFEEQLSVELENCVAKLVESKCYDCAFKIAEAQGIPADFVVINECEEKFEKRGSGFWDDCEAAFAATGVESVKAVGFFEKCCEEIEDNVEKCKVLALAHRWSSSCSLDVSFAIEEKLWTTFFQTRPKIDMTVAPDARMLYGDMKNRLESLKESSTTLDDEQRLHLHETLETLLKQRNLWPALCLARMFKFQSDDLDMLTLICSLAEGLIMPYQMTVEQRLLINRGGRVRRLSHRGRGLLSSRRLSSSFSSTASTLVPAYEPVDPLPPTDTLLTLEALVDRVKVGIEVAQNALMTYRIAANIEKSYQAVFRCEDPMDMLKQALNDDCSNKLEVVRDFCTLFKWSKDQIAGLLCEELISSVKFHVKAKIEPVIMWNLSMESDFPHILQLLVENCSILGVQLYSFASALHRNQLPSSGDFKISEISLVIELLIRAHDCFTADCNMEGISMVLRKCQALISLLLVLKSWKLIVRLLTGVGRYTEMNYVFHLLRENAQFEFLLRTGSRKLDNGLKMALLKYLKKYCPEDRELYRMVGLYFTLYSEVATLWEEEARSIVRNLIAISKLEMQNNGLQVENEPFVLLTNTDGTKICLNKAMADYIHASDFHLQGERLTKAMAAAKQAELLTLQLSMFKGLSGNGTVFCILNLSNLQISKLISKEVSFAQSLILVEAYDHKADWASAIFEQFVLGNHSSYLEGFCASFPLSETLVHDISRKFLALRAISDTTTRNMKEIVQRCPSIKTQYRVASELGFSDLVEELLAGNQLAFLKDTVWKKGYKS